MAKVIFLCGFIGSGKTTYAKKLAAELPAFRFTMDEWMIPLFGEHMEREVFDARKAVLYNLFQQSALSLLKLGTSVIFDCGLWQKAERLEVAQWAQAEGFEFELHYLDVSFEQCCDRAYSRNKQRGEHAYEMTPAMMEMFWQQFELPSEEDVVWVTSKPLRLT
ncbi:AAA family ATPase [Agarivorans litoreus]|uniref:AAA family ATPase n=1 Tax=Agarivorans litoreus TaxID=1510455 RepID=UPI001C7D139F|nr:ATP-binding protein [Agarivorans litoreus]